MVADITAYGLGAAAGLGAYFVSSKILGEVLFPICDTLASDASFKEYESKIFSLIRMGTSGDCSAQNLKEIIGDHDFQYLQSNVKGEIQDGKLVQNSDTSEYNSGNYSGNFSPAFHTRILQDMSSDSFASGSLAGTIMTLFATLVGVTVANAMKK